MTPELRIGCSGWTYKSWKGEFYPADLPASQWLRYYADAFDTVEVNNTFYRLPEATTFASWRKQTADSFVMAVKASRFLTHLKRLREPKEPLNRLFSRAKVLGSRLGPVLYQLPANFHIDLSRLEQFLKALPARVRAPRDAGSAIINLLHVMEFRHPSWYVDDTFQLLEHHGVVLCLHDKLGAEIATPFVGPSVYIRFHGPSGLYHGSYPTRALNKWADRLGEQWQSGRDVFAYFNNDPNAAATENAGTLRDRLTRMVGLARPARRLA